MKGSGLFATASPRVALRCVALRDLVLACRIFIDLVDRRTCFLGVLSIESHMRSYLRARFLSLGGGVGLGRVGRGWVGGV